ncbi:hypothetical protein HDV06_006550 [Boothiomyces sp. JEL0866]|nr:hypothetical protein HDV06_006550 [Boothiomyces sp. JEL0866]
MQSDKINSEPGIDSHVVPSSDIPNSNVSIEQSQPAPLIYMHSHDPENPLTNLCKDPDCTLNNPSTPSVSVNTKLENYLNNLPKHSKPVHPDMYNLEIATEVGVESSISQQDQNYIRMINTTRFEQEITNDDAQELEKIKMELRSEIEEQIRAEVEAKLRAEFESQSNNSQTERDVSQNSQSDSTSVDSYDQLRQLQGKFDDEAYKLRLSQARERHNFQQEHFKTIAIMQLEKASPEEIAGEQDSYNYELIELESRFKRERKSIDDRAFEALRHIIEHQRKKPKRTK